MTLPELTAYVRKRLRKGYPAGMLQEELLQQGHPADTVDQSFTPKRQWAGRQRGLAGASSGMLLVLFYWDYCGSGRSIGSISPSAAS